MIKKRIFCVVVGDDIRDLSGRSEKVAFLTAYTTRSPPSEYVPSFFEDYSENIIFEDQVIDLHLKEALINDFNWKQRSYYYDNADIFILLFSLVSPNTLRNIENMWVPDINNHCSDPKYILVGTNSSLRDNFLQHESEYKSKGWNPIPTAEGEEIKRKINALDYVECDPDKLFHIREVIDAAVRAVIHPSINFVTAPKSEPRQKESKFHKWKNQKKLKNKKSKIGKSITLHTNTEDISSKTLNSANENNNDNEYKKESNQIKLYISLPNEYEEFSSKMNLDISLPSECEEFSSKINLELSKTISKEKYEKKNEPVAQIKNYFVGREEEDNHIFIGNIERNPIYKTIKIFDVKERRVMCKKILIPEDYIFEHLQNIMKEFEVLVSINHPCICRIFGLNTSEELKKDENNDVCTTVALFLEYLEYNFKDAIEKIQLTNTIKTQIAVEIAHGLLYLHNNSMIYRDLKCNSIRLNSEFNAKIVDFGFVKINEALFPEYTSTKSSMLKSYGDHIFMSPELLKGDKYDYKTDIYSFGILLYFIFCGKLPKYSLKEKISGQEIKLPEKSNSISQNCIDIMQKCLSLDPNDRPSSQEILEQIRCCSYNLAPNVDIGIVEKRDLELNQNAI